MNSEGGEGKNLYRLEVWSFTQYCLQNSISSLMRKWRSIFCQVHQILAGLKPVLFPFHVQMNLFPLQKDQQ